MVNNLHLYSILVRGGQVRSLVGHTAHRASRSVTDFDADLGALTMSPRLHTKSKLASTRTKSP